MASVIKIKRSSTASQVPGSLAAGELAINLTDKKLFSSNGSVVFEVGATNLANTNARINLLNTNLTGTNTALRTLISDRLQVSNAAATYATKTNPTTSGLLAHTGRATISTNLTVSGNTTIAGLKANNSLGSADQVLKTNGTTAYWGTVAAVSTSQYLQVANAVATYQTKAVERAALANTNLRINLINTNLTSTNTALRTLISDRLQVSNASTLYTTKSNPTTSGLLAHTGRATISTNLAVTGNTTIAGLRANNTLGTAGQVLKTNGTTVYWDVDNSGGGGGLVSTTTATVKNLTQNDVVVTGVTAAVSTNYLQVANAVATYATKVNPTTSGLLAHTGRATISTNLAVTGNTTIAGLRANNTLGTADQVLKTNGTTVYWGTAAGGGGGSTSQY